MIRGKTALFALLCFFVAHEAESQFSGYISHSQSFHQNPLFNSQGSSDRLSESYAEFVYDQDYGSSALQLKYAGGLMMFDKYAERNSYEHALQGMSTFFFAPSTAATDSEESEVAVTPDSAGNFLDVGAAIVARHDKSGYDEFDNWGGQAFGSYRFHVADQLAGRLSVPLQYRNYTNLPTLSNVVTGVNATLFTSPVQSIGYSLYANAGYKYYTSSLYDTARFESKRTFVSHGAGKGKGGANLNAASSKQILINAQASGIVHVTIGGSVKKVWKGASLAVEASYGINPGDFSRYLAQNVNTSMLSDDLYNDHFAYQGPTVVLHHTAILILNLHSVMHFEFQRKRFGAPALDIDGVQTADNRIDLRGSASWTVSRKFPIGRASALEISLSVETSRNMSNDMYNDFSYTFAAVTLGLNF